MRTYTELITFPTFEERFNYLKLDGKIGEETFGFDRYLNQVLYRSSEWKTLRRDMIIRDNGCDLGLNGHEIFGRVYIHHMNPITLKQIERRDPDILNPEFLICVSQRTHNAIHYGDENLLPKDPVIRRPNDMCPWKQ